MNDTEYHEKSYLCELTNSRIIRPVQKRDRNEPGSLESMEKQTTIEERFGKCPYATAQSLISGKWAVLILLYLEDGPIRFNELLRRMPKMTHATLSVQLKSLEEYGLVRRVQYEAIPPKVEYSLTDIGKKFHPVVAAMEAWGNEYIAQMNGGNEQ